jgi:hypothetical protein
MDRHVARDLTDSGQNRLVLQLASAGDRTATGEHTGVAVEAAAIARARERLRRAGGPVHLTVVWAMYGETGRIRPRSEHPHGEDFVRAKVAQLDWLTAGRPGLTWSVVAVDDGCPDSPSSADVMEEIVRAEGYPSSGHRSVTVLRLAGLLGSLPVGPAFEALTSPDQSRKGGSILAGLKSAVDAGLSSSRQVVCYTDADLSANLAQLGALAAAILAKEGVVAALGQRYGMPGAVLVKENGPSVEPQSTGDKPDKNIILFRHVVRALLMPSLAHVLDTQAGFKAFDATALAPVLPEMTSFDETFDVELLIHLAQRYGPAALAPEPIVFTEDFAATNFPSVDPGARHLAMVKQVVEVYDRFVAAHAPATGEAAELLTLVRDLDLAGYVRLITALRAEDAGDPTLFDRRWPVSHLRSLTRGQGA